MSFNLKKIISTKYKTNTKIMDIEEKISHPLIFTNII